MTWRAHADFTLDALATYRLVRLVRDDTIAEPVRQFVRRWGHDYGPTGEGYAEELLSCGWCLSVWAAGAVLVLRGVPGGRVVRDLLALSGVAGIAGELVEGR